MTAIVTDACASIPPELAEGPQIEIVPYYIHRGNESLRDLLDISHQEFYEWLPTARELPTTANPSPGDYLQAFERVAERTSEIVTITMTSKGSGAYQSACVAREMAAAYQVCQIGCMLMAADTLKYCIWAGELAEPGIWRGLCSTSNRSSASRRVSLSLRGRLSPGSWN